MPIVRIDGQFAGIVGLFADKSYIESCTANNDNKSYKTLQLRRNNEIIKTDNKRRSEMTILKKLSEASLVKQIIVAIILGCILAYFSPEPQNHSPY